MIRAIICGGRDRHLGAPERKWLTQFHEEVDCVEIITGGATGVDTDADVWAKEQGIDRIIFPANWEKDGRAAGPLRNTRMLHYLIHMSYPGQRMRPPESVCITFPGGRGTANMVTQARCAGIRVIRYV